MRETIEVLVTVKAYPNPSQRYGEAVCVAGIRTDVDPHAWVRLYPIQFRDLPKKQQFDKYDYITLDVIRHSDPRPESLRPIAETIAVGAHIGTANRWSARRKLVEPFMTSSMCELLRRQRAAQTSLGIFRPEVVEELVIESESAEWASKQQGIVRQPSLLNPGKTELEKIPYKVSYKYRCSEKTCRGHTRSIVDWELGEACRKWPKKYGKQHLPIKLREKWFEELCGPSIDTAFFSGNMHTHPRSFLILGVFWPPKRPLQMFDPETFA